GAVSRARSAAVPRLSYSRYWLSRAYMLLSATATFSSSAFALRSCPLAMIPATAKLPPTRSTRDTAMAAMTRMGSVAARSPRSVRRVRRASLSWLIPNADAARAHPVGGVLSAGVADAARFGELSTHRVVRVAESGGDVVECRCVMEG